MDIIIPQSLRSIFGRKAVQALNACAKFCNNFSQGFGIKNYRNDGSIAVGINTDDANLQDWIRAVASSGKSGEPKSLTSGAQEDVPTDDLYDVDPATEENMWERGEEDDQDPPKPIGVEFFICCRATDDNADGAIFFRKVRFDGLGHLVLVGNEDETCGAVVTYVDRSM